VHTLSKMKANLFKIRPQRPAERVSERERASPSHTPLPYILRHRHENFAGSKISNAGSQLDESLVRSGFQTSAPLTVTKDFEKAQHSDFCLVILDVMLPKRDGWILLSELLATKKNSRVLMAARARR